MNTPDVQNSRRAKSHIPLDSERKVKANRNDSLEEESQGRLTQFLIESQNAEVADNIRRVHGDNSLLSAEALTRLLLGQVTDHR